MCGCAFPLICSARRNSRFCEYKTSAQIVQTRAPQEGIRTLSTNRNCSSLSSLVHLFCLLRTHSSKIFPSQGMVRTLRSKTISATWLPLPPPEWTPSGGLQIATDLLSLTTRPDISTFPCALTVHSVRPETCGNKQSPGRFHSRDDRVNQKSTMAQAFDIKHHCSPDFKSMTEIWFASGPIKRISVPLRAATLQWKNVESQVTKIQNLSEMCKTVFSFPAKALQFASDLTCWSRGLYFHGCDLKSVLPDTASKCATHMSCSTPTTVVGEVHALFCATQPANTSRRQGEIQANHRCGAH